VEEKSNGQKEKQDAMSHRDNLKIARRLNAGNNAPTPASPGGTAENGISAVPSGLEIFLQPIPALKCRAIVVCSYGTKQTGSDTVLPGMHK
jgi:hypothetical protein